MPATPCGCWAGARCSPPPPWCRSAWGWPPAAPSSASPTPCSGPPPGYATPPRVVDVGRGNQGQRLRQHVAPRLRVPARARRPRFDGPGRRGVRRPADEPDRGRTRAERVFGTLVSANFFEVLGTRPALGRFFRPDEDARAGRAPGRGAHPPLLDPPPRRRSRPCCDRPLRLNNREFAVVGVAEPGFEGVTLAGTDLLRADGDGGRGPRPGHRRPAHRRPRCLARRRRPAEARRHARDGGGRAEHADDPVQGGEPDGQPAPHRRARCRPAACRGRCARRSWSSSACCSR